MRAKQLDHMAKINLHLAIACKLLRQCQECAKRDNRKLWMELKMDCKIGKLLRAVGK